MTDADDRPRSAARGTPEIDIIASSAADLSLASAVRATADRAAAHMGVSGQIRVRLVRDAEMAALHERHTGVRGTTDVLTFDLRDDPDPTDPVLDLDVLLCVDEAERQSRARGVPIVSELTLYFVHALLHCLGHDDHDDVGYARMHEAEDRVLSAIGLGPVFGREPLDQSGPDGGGVT